VGILDNCVRHEPLVYPLRGQLAANPTPISIANIPSLTASAAPDQHAGLKGAISLLVALVWAERR
jgi:hypothetical protein